jgi:hypothetical protein
MKNVQIIDGAINCAYSVYQMSDESFRAIFPDEGQNVEFIDDLIARMGEAKAGQILDPVWKHRIEKRNAHGIHGTLFFELPDKKKFYPTKRESDLDQPQFSAGTPKN